MKTIVTGWYIVALTYKEHVIGEIVWGQVVEDFTCRFRVGDYVCSSKVINSFEGKRFFQTASNSIYQTIGSGEKAAVDLKYIELLRAGISPKDIEKVMEE